MQHNFDICSQKLLNSQIDKNNFDVQACHIRYVCISSGAIPVLAENDIELNHIQMCLDIPLVQHNPKNKAKTNKQTEKNIHTRAS